MTFLELAQRLRQEAGVAGNGPGSVVAQSGELKRLVDWVASSWNDIQIAKTNWRWMRGEFTFLTVAGQMAYNAQQAGINERFSHWLLDYTSLGLTPPNDEVALSDLSYDEFRAIYMVGPQPQGRPVAVSVSPSQNLLLGHRPDAAYTVRGEYHKQPQVLKADGDVPEMPVQFHEAILYAALMKYARYMAAAEIYEDALMNYRRIMQQLMTHQLPDVTAAEALA